jgi:hypothetical protein
VAADEGLLFAAEINAHAAKDGGEIIRTDGAADEKRNRMAPFLGLPFDGGGACVDVLEVLVTEAQAKIVVRIEGQPGRGEDILASNVGVFEPDKSFETDLTEIEFGLAADAEDVDVIDGGIAGIGADEEALGIAEEEVPGNTAREIAVKIGDAAIDLEAEGTRKRQGQARFALNALAIAEIVAKVAARNRRLAVDIRDRAEIRRGAWIGAVRCPEC